MAASPSDKTVAQPSEDSQPCEHIRAFAQFYVTQPVVLMAAPESDNAVIVGCARCQDSGIMMLERGIRKGATT